ncbi:hypothetical protein [Trichloromonas sp.]|uniref:hypothetical protein n=1 Tax=Trichloromonas sp. TaxID=3069249 RepID=UPI002A44FC38|nr:hypothetical protein [Trichloromonas sp.]
METGTLIHSEHLDIRGRRYEVAVFQRANGSHVARTVFAPGDVIMNDGPSLEAVLAKHQRLLPLAIDSRELRGESR